MVLLPYTFQNGKSQPLNIFIFVDKLRIILPEDISYLFIQCVAGTLGGFSTTVLTNPMDTIRARLQVCNILCHYLLLKCFSCISELMLSAKCPLLSWITCWIYAVP